MASADPTAVRRPDHNLTPVGVRRRSHNLTPVGVRRRQQPTPIGVRRPDSNPPRLVSADAGDGIRHLDSGKGLKSRGRTLAHFVRTHHG